MLKEHTETKHFSLFCGDPKVSIEIGTKGGVPGFFPAHTFLVSLDGGEGSFGDQNPGGIPGMQVSWMSHIIHHHGAAIAEAVILWMVHEMVYDQLLSACKQVLQRHVSFWSFKSVLLFNPHHRQPSSFSGQGIFFKSELLFFEQQIVPGFQPVFLGRDLRCLRIL